MATEILSQNWSLHCPECDRGDYALVQEDGRCLATCAICSYGEDEFPVGAGECAEEAIAAYVAFLYRLRYGRPLLRLDPNADIPDDEPS